MRFRLFRWVATQWVAIALLRDTLRNESTVLRVKARIWHVCAGCGGHPTSVQRPSAWPVPAAQPDAARGTSQGVRLAQLGHTRKSNDGRCSVAWLSDCLAAPLQAAQQRAARWQAAPLLQGAGSSVVGSSVVGGSCGASVTTCTGGQSSTQVRCAVKADMQQNDSSYFLA